MSAVHATSQAETSGRAPKIYSSQFGRMARLIRLLVNGQKLSAFDAAQALDCHQDRTRGLLRVMHEAALVHVSGWDHRECGPWFPIYAWSAEEPQEDVARPAHIRTEVPHV